MYTKYIDHEKRDTHLIVGCDKPINLINLKDTHMLAYNGESDLLLFNIKN